MAVIDLNSFLSRLKSGDFEGRYIFAGEEEFLMRHYLGMLVDAVVAKDGFETFNHTVFDGGEIDFGALIDAIESPPMMSEYKLVEWRHADFSKLREDELKALEEVILIHEGHPEVVLAFLALPGSVDFGTAKKQSKLLTRFPSLSVLNFKRSKDEQLHSWIERHFSAAGIKISLGAAKAMVDRIGHSMNVLKGEIDKLTAYIKAHGRAEVTTEDVSEVCVSVPETDFFDFNNAIIERNKTKIFDVLEEKKMSRTEPLYILANMRSEYEKILDIMLLLKDGLNKDDIAKLLKMHPYSVGIYINNMKKHTPQRLSEILDAISRADENIKRDGVDGYTAVEILISQYI